MVIELVPLNEDYSIYKVSSLDEILKIETKGIFCSITKTDDEISIICISGLLKNYIKCEPDWKGFKIKGLLDFSLVGIINDVTKPLKDNNISVFVVATFNTDYIFVKAEKFELAKEIFKFNKKFNLIFD
jgi:uncharacterized protein